MKRLLIPFLALLITSPAMAIDYSECEAMRRRFRIDTREQMARAEQARSTYWKQSKPKSPPGTPTELADCTKGGIDMDCIRRLQDSIQTMPSYNSPRWREGERIYAKVLLQPTEHTHRIADDMHAAGCF